MTKRLACLTAATLIAAVGAAFSPDDAHDNSLRAEVLQRRPVAASTPAGVAEPPSAGYADEGGAWQR